MYDIQYLLRRGFTDWKSLGNVSVSERGKLRLFNYTPSAQFEGRWNYFERVSRGLILDSETGEVVARPFDKFFNWGEGERYSSAPIRLVTEKMDGSLGILYRENGEYRIATRGSFESDQALWATDFLKRYDFADALSSDLTLLFEIIYPDNRIVVDYQGREDLVLLAARQRESGDYLPWVAIRILAQAFGFSLPRVYQFDMPEDLLDEAQTLDANSEGWVVDFEDGQRFKFKGEEYRKLHKLISGLSFKNTLKCVAGDSLDELRAVVPDEFLDEVNAWVDEIQETVSKTANEIEGAFAQAPKDTRKDFALWVMANHKSLAPYLFARLDGKPVEPIIYNMAFSDRTDNER